jgi:hypothetical protein
MSTVEELMECLSKLDPKSKIMLEAYDTFRLGSVMCTHTGSESTVILVAEDPEDVEEQE